MCQYKTSQYNYRITIGDNVVLHNFLTKAVIEVSSVACERIDRLLSNPNSQHAKDDDLLPLLRSQGLIVPSDLDELDVIKYRYYSSLFARGATQLTLVILPTLWCNFRCPYCFEVRRKEVMNQKTRMQLLEFVDYALHNKDCLYVSWFGGEPLLCKAAIEELSAGFRQLSNKHHCTYDATLTTNGYYLDTAFIASFEKMGISSLQVTLDGAPQHHDSYRRLPDGKGTFDTIHRNIETLCQLTHDDFQVDLRINCTEDNVRHIPDLFSLFSSDVKKKARLFFRWIYPAEASGFRTFTAGIADEDRFGILAALYQSAIAAGWSVDEPVNTAPIYCEVDSINFFQISPAGDVFLCSDTYETAESIGNVSEWQKWVECSNCGWYAASPFHDSECIKCILLPYCMGGCRKARVAGRRACVDELKDVGALVRVLYESALNQDCTSGF